jgi:UDP:flavonoid glycosyltransferase YjiC (YdhE family)
MRVLLASSLGGVGHLEPVVAVGQALRRMRHDPMVLAPPSLKTAVERTGLPYAIGAQPPAAAVEEIWNRVRAGPEEHAVGLIDRELFADQCTAAMLGAARRVCEAWKPRLVVRESCEYASAVVAREDGIAQLQVGLSLAELESGVLTMVEPIIDRYGRGVAGAVRAAPYLTRFPESLDPSPWADTRRYRQPGPAARSLPAWWPSDDRPLIYLTFGTVLGHLSEAADVYRTALDAVADVSARVLLTVGREVDPDRLGAVPENTRVEQWVAQTDVFAQAALVVCHGGSGTTFGALAAGVPLVVCPLFADQPRNGRLVEAAGAGLQVTAPSGFAGVVRALGPADVTPLRAAVERVLIDPTCRDAAVRVALEMATAPTLEEVLHDVCHD